MEKIKNQIKAAPWLFVYLVMEVLTAVNLTMIRALSPQIGGENIAALRYGLAVIILLPFAIKVWRKHARAIRRNFWKMLLIGIPFAFGAPLINLATQYSSASFVAILAMLVPVVFAIISVAATHDRVSRSALTGILFAILGGMIVIILPLVLQDNVGWYGWLPLIFIGIYILIEAALPVYLRKSDEAGLPLPVVMITQFALVAVVSLVMSLIMNDGVGELVREVRGLSLSGWGMILYLALIVTVISRWLTTKAQENIGTATSTTIMYLYQVLAVAAPVLILHENLSPEMIAGAGLIIVGIWLTRKHHRHHPRIMYATRR
jgi:drug/metabolite transporter (DMT)-like permease